MAIELVSTTGDAFILPEKEFGVVNDSSDQTAKMQAAWDAASAQGRIVILPPWQVTVSSLNIPVNGIEVWGVQGIGNGVPRSELVSIGINAPVIQSIANSRRVTLRGFGVRGTDTGSSQHGIKMGGTESAYFRLQDLYVQHCGGNGIHIQPSDYSYVLDSIYSTWNKGHQFYIDAVNSPSVFLLNCYAGVVETNKFGYYLRRGQVELVNCNMLDGGTPPLSCVQVGESAVGTCVAVMRNCNFESFTDLGVFVDVLSDVRLYNCAFVPSGGFTTQPLYLIQPSGRSFIDEATLFNYAGGTTFQNAANHPIKIYSGWIDTTSGANPYTSRITDFWNSEFGRLEPMMNSGSRLAASATVTTATWQEVTPTANYIGVNRAGAVTITLLDPQDSRVPEGRPITIKDESNGAAANNITINTTNARNLDFTTSKVINTNGGSIRLVKRGGQYWVA